MVWCEGSESVVDKSGCACIVAAEMKESLGYCGDWVTIWNARDFHGE